MIVIPKSKRGQKRNSPLEVQYQVDLAVFCKKLVETGAGMDLADPRHPDHHKPYVQD
jgi:hypothetical protein